MTYLRPPTERAAAENAQHHMQVILDGRLGRLSAQRVQLEQADQWGELAQNAASLLVAGATLPGYTLGDDNRRRAALSASLWAGDMDQHEPGDYVDNLHRAADLILAELHRLDVLARSVRVVLWGAHYFAVHAHSTPEQAAATIGYGLKLAGSLPDGLPQDVDPDAVQVVVHAQDRSYTVPLSRWLRHRLGMNPNVAGQLLALSNGSVALAR